MQPRNGRRRASLRAEQSGDQIPVEASFSSPVQTAPETHPATSLPGEHGRAVTLTTHPT
jgi:hypothetical protein